MAPAAVTRALEAGSPQVGERQDRDVAYVEVWATMRGSGHAATLWAAGFIVEDSKHHAGHLVVFKTPAR